VSGPPSPGPRAPRLDRLERFGVRPDKDLGQNFLVDLNLLEVIERLAELDSDDVVLEVGGGLGVLSEHLAPRVRHLHVVEIDPRLVPALEDALAPFANATLHRADVLALALAELAPAPGKVVANLPYGVAAPFILESVAGLPRVERWVTMVQREVADRLAAGPGSRVYGAPSVLAQLSCDVRVARRVPATVFHPAPHVQSALVVLRRVRPPAPATTRALVHAAFAHRRKALAGSLVLAPGAPAGIRDRARAALEALGHPADARAERLGPGDFRALADALGHEDLDALAARAPR
jgi:16S rRNA (adenine1518-N6/adenine1519-N6)-dimethyltransferase